MSSALWGAPNYVCVSPRVSLRTRGEHWLEILSLAPLLPYRITYADELSGEAILLCQGRARRMFGTQAVGSPGDGRVGRKKLGACRLSVYLCGHGLV
jgi:hypothetical protein